MTKLQKKKESIIMGIDPGTTIMGYSIIIVNGAELSLIQYGVIHLSKYKDHYLKLAKIYERVTQLIVEYNPNEIAIEAPFYGKNIQSMLKLGRAQGVAMAAALGRDIPITEYAPKLVKQSVTGNGNSTKEQVAGMLGHIFKIKELPKLLDATDALAVCVCHAYRGDSSKKKKIGWSDFIQQNPKRVK